MTEERLNDLEKRIKEYKDYERKMYNKIVEVNNRLNELEKKLEDKIKQHELHKHGIIKL